MIVTDKKWREVIDAVLAESSTPLHYTDIAERIVVRKLRTNLGATPSATVNAQISRSIKNDGSNSPYVRVDRGVFALKSMIGVRLPAIDRGEENINAEVEEFQYDIITSFGMFWRRDNVEWSAMPKLYGVQQLGADSVDFCKQIGIYLLYDGREVIYVGRSTDRPLGRRLYEHTADRMATRWDRFSWFGLLPISETGNIGSLPASYPAEKLVPALEAILIEALEPRQNRKRGDDLAAVEYSQKTDPDIDKRKAKAIIDRI
jgi:hypothetical protein